MNNPALYRPLKGNQQAYIDNLSICNKLGSDFPDIESGVLFGDLFQKYLQPSAFNHELNRFYVHSSYTELDVWPAL